MIPIIFFFAVSVLTALFSCIIPPSSLEMIALEQMIEELFEAIREDGPDVEELA